MTSSYNYDREYGTAYIDDTVDIDNVPAISNLPDENTYDPTYFEEPVFDEEEDENAVGIGQAVEDIEAKEATQGVQVTKEVTVGQKCTIKYANKRNIFDSNNYIINLSEDELSNLNKYLPDDTGKPYSICNVKDNIAYENCALATGNPYLSLTYDQKTARYVCSLPEAKNIKLPVNERYQVTYNHNTSNIVRPVSEIYLKKEQYTFCEQRWHDWFCIPNYHLNNGWYNELPTDLKDTESVGRCLQPCNFGYVPTDENVGKCILKNNYNGGAYANVFDYIPLALVCLLGTTFESFINETGGYIYYLDKVVKPNINNDTSIELLKNAEEDVINNVIKNLRNKDNKIWDDVKNDIQYYIKNMLKKISNINDRFIERNIVEPPSDVIGIIKAKAYINEPQIRYAYSIAKHISDMYLDVDKYKGWRTELKSMTLDLITEISKSNFDTLEDAKKYKGETDEQRIKRKSDTTFAYLLRMLKRACNICFDGKTAYSSGTLLFTINQDANYRNDPISLDETYDPTDDDIHINDFYIIPKKEVGFFDDYVNTIKSYESSLSTFLYFLIIVLVIFAMYVIYIVFYKYINIILNTILSFLIFRYYDIKYYMNNLFWSKWDADNRQSAQLNYIKDTYYNFIDYDNEQYDLDLPIKKKT